ncbi:MAG TPA: HAD family hydrolase [Candidatus Saccharimonadales bacterium]|nr:HAD family hydrolase [Candidatus Saccharimonadales bacterium]
MIGSREKIRLGVFDVNGTIHTDATGIPGEIKAGFENLHEQGIGTTIITGRGLSTARALLGHDWPIIVSEGLPASTENGSRLISADGKVVRHHPLSDDEVVALADGIKDASESIRYLAYHPLDTEAGAVLWATGLKPVDDFAKRHGSYERFHSSWENLISDLVKDQVSMVIIGGDKSAAEALAGSNVIINGTELNVLSAGVDKARGIEDIVEHLDLDLSEAIVAGNDHNDLSMLALDVGRSIFVEGALDKSPLAEGLEVVEDTQGLGQYLQSF